MAVIAHTRVVTAHEGHAELLVTLRYSNGGAAEIALDPMAVNALLDACGVSSPDQLEGQPWHKVRDALGVSWNRFNPAHRPAN